MVVIGASQGAELEIKETSIVIKGSKGSPYGMTLAKFKKSGKEDSFSIIK
jgi:hypothetical protein